MKDGFFIKLPGIQFGAVGRTAVVILGSLVALVLVVGWVRHVSLETELLDAIKATLDLAAVLPHN